MKPIHALRILGIVSILGLATSCRQGGGSASAGGETSGPVSLPPDPNPVGPIPPSPDYGSDLDRSFGIASGILARMRMEGPGGCWDYQDENGKVSQPAAAYTGQAGVILYLARLQRVRPHPEIEKALVLAGRWLQAQHLGLGPGLYEGRAGVGWAFLELYETLGDRSWLDSALGLAADVAADRTELEAFPGDLVAGHGGEGLFLLKVHRVTGDGRWLQAARTKADEVLSKAVPAGRGIKFLSRISSTQTVSYVGFAHGAAGMGHYFCRLSEALGAEGAPYLRAAEDVAAWLQSIAIEGPTGLNWYRREPDQTNQQQNQWCHGAPGIGLFLAELYARTRNPAYLDLARRAAATSQTLGQSMTCLCHGSTGNAQLCLRLYLLTGEAAYLQQAREAGNLLWVSWDRRFHYPSWMGDDGSPTLHNVNLMTGDAGRAHFFLSLADPARWPMPFTE